MKVQVRGKGFLKKMITDGEVVLKPGTRLAELPTILNLPADYRLYYYVNGKAVKSDIDLNEGDIIDIVSALAGG